MKLIRLQEQIAENTCIHQDIAQDIIPHMKDGENIVFCPSVEIMIISLPKAHISLGLIGFLREM